MVEKVTKIQRLPYEEAAFDFTEELIQECRNLAMEPSIVGQPRALRSLEMGLAIQKGGYNLFVSGNSGSGRLGAIKASVERFRSDISILQDIVYAYNFLQPDSPLALTFPPKEGQRFSDAMELFSQKIAILAQDRTTFLEKATSLLTVLQTEFSTPTLSVQFNHILSDLRRQASHIQNLSDEQLKKDPFARKYRVNLLVNHSKTGKRPLVIENYPTFSNLFGTLDDKQEFAHLGLHAGSLLEAEGGFIVINAEELLSEEGLWDSLKRYLDASALALQADLLVKGELRKGQIRPQMTKIPVKVILMGNEDTFDALTEHDERFLILFKVSSQFDFAMPSDKEHIAKTIANLIDFAAKNNCRPLDNSAIAQILRYSAWYAESRTELTTQFSQLYDIIIEANYWAEAAKEEIIDRRLVLKANEERDYFSNITELRINEEILNGEMLISLTGSKVGVVNGLAIMDRGASSFGTPTVITASVAPGSEGIVNIEHEAGLSGEIHDKGLLILEGYLRKHYARTFPLSIYAGIAFEQSYAEVDGDSASSSELYALLSAIGELPVRQDIAVTGSVNQMGMIQPVGGINEKIEGFYRTCLTTGLTGKQGVIIPVQNLRNLIISYEVLEAIREKKFHIYPITTIDEGMRILTGRPFGVRNAKGNYSAGNFNLEIEDRLRKMYQAVTSSRS
ncbi:MAG TPA: AAA family ATPase [Sphaerochaeta sp.]|nr:AAA family ATPase [Sphaerochaeta sp.]